MGFIVYGNGDEWFAARKVDLEESLELIGVEPTPIPPNVATTVEVAVAKALATPRSGLGPNTQATVEAQVHATVQALYGTPTSTSTPEPTSTPVPTVIPPTPTVTPEPTSTPVPTVIPPTPTVTPKPTGTPVPTVTPPTPTVTPKPTGTPAGTTTPPSHPPDLRHVEEKRYMLELINAERAKVGVSPVVLGDNVAAQMHAESALESCFSSHWGIDGLKPYMRYSLAGGYQSNGENGHGSDYCIRASDGYRAIRSIEQEVREAMDGWMGSPGHRRNILDPWHRKINIGLAWDRYNVMAVQHFEGDYVEYDQLPAIEDGVLAMSGTTKNGVMFEDEQDLGVQIYYDPPPHTLTRGQVSRTYCYGGGEKIVSLRPPLSGGWFYTEDEYTTTHKPCPDPYDVPPDAPAPQSHDESYRFWQAAYDASQSREERTIIVQRVTARSWRADGALFEVTADIGGLLSRYGNGVYTVLMWGALGGEDLVISEYSIFHGVTPPDTYN